MNLLKCVFDVRVTAFVLLSFICACGADHPAGPVSGSSLVDDSISATGKSPEAAPAKDQDTVLLQVSYDVLKLLKTRNYGGLSTWISASGVRFSPYAYIDTVKDQKISAAAMADLSKSKKLLEWGNYDGNGEPIMLNLDKYFDKFVYDADFIKAEKYSINRFIGQGNSLNNLKDVYPAASFTEFYFPGTAKNNNMDWRSLRLVFRKSGKKYYLIAIIHDQWTI